MNGEEPVPADFGIIYKTYYNKAFLFSKSYVKDQLVAEDIASESLLAFWRQIKREEVKYPVALLLTILKNKSLDYIKHNELQYEVFDKLTENYKRELTLRISSLEAFEPESLFVGELRKIIEDTLASLPEQTRRIFEMSRYENKSNKDIAENLEITTKGVEYHISKALKVLRTNLKDYLPLFYFLFLP